MSVKMSVSHVINYECTSRDQLIECKSRDQLNEAIFDNIHTIASSLLSSVDDAVSD